MKTFYYGTYTIDRKGVIRRKTRAQGTSAGRVLKPYTSNPDKAGSNQARYVSLCRGAGKCKVFNYDRLVIRFGCHQRLET